MENNPKLIEKQLPEVEFKIHLPLTELINALKHLDAKEKKADFVILDEKRARKVASNVGLEVIGCIGILFEAKTKGFFSIIN